MATSIKLDDLTRERVKAVAKRQDRTPHWILKRAVDEYLEREEKREAFRMEALESLSRYRKDGKHLTLDETTAWMKKWKDGERAPECHR